MPDLPVANVVVPSIDENDLWGWQPSELIFPLAMTCGQGFSLNGVIGQAKETKLVHDLIEFWENLEPSREGR